MRGIKSIFVLGILSVLISGSSIHYRSSKVIGLNEPVKINWKWEGSFSSYEKSKIKDWLTSVTRAVESTLGSYPFDMDFYVYRRDNSSEPVPWAHTERNYGQGVHFYIDPEYSQQQFMDDWTAPHEISHLSIPYLGRSNSWFAEGYASFMQYQVMRNLGIYSEAQMQSRYDAKLENVVSYYQKDQDMATIARSMGKARKYPQMYWGGATYFMNLDRTLRKEHNTSLLQLVKTYQECCRLEDESLADLLSSWDEILGAPLCQDLLQKYQTEPARDIIQAFTR